tara:strand:- start:617 stop:1282 length:666 start_codon:yes stop_codon:yes gene_type:complete
MGYSIREIKKISPILSEYPTKTIMCELGNSYIKGDDFVEWLDANDMGDLPIGGEQHTKGIVSKYFWERIGYEYLSVDMNRYDYSHYLDLRKQVPAYVKDTFDIVLDVGTIEHVQNQYMAFYNTDYMTKVGGVNIHFLPKVGTWPGHCSYYYDMSNFEKLADICGYEVVNISEEYHPAGSWICAVMIKGDNGFPSVKEFKKIGIHYVDGYANDQSHYPWAYE